VETSSGFLEAAALAAFDDQAVDTRLGRLQR
jgi:hypothetical protein